MLDGGQLRTRKLDEIAQSIGLKQSVNKPGKVSNGLTELETKQEKGTLGTAQAVTKQRKAPRSNWKDEEENSEFENPIMQEAPLFSRELSTIHDNGKSSDPFVTEEDGEQVLSDGSTIKDESDNTDDDENEEYFMLPPTQGRVDPAVLASLPPSMQLNLLVQMREQLVTDNRKKFQKVAKDPASFSQLQIQAYLKTVAFRRDINQVQKAAAGKGVGGLPSARIASEVDREYIFSTSFQPERQAVEVDKSETHHPSRVSVNDFHDSNSNQAQQRVGEGGDVQQHMEMTERATLKESSPEKVLEDNKSPDDKDIEWNDEDECVVPLSCQPVKGAAITVEIDQDDLLANGVEMQELFPAAGSESEEIEWEDDASALDCINGDEQEDVATTMVQCEPGNSLHSLTGVDSPEIADRRLMEIEAAELEEAIRQSLKDHKGSKVSKLIIRDESTMEIEEQEVLPLDSIPVGSILSEEAYFARERERKGKGIAYEEKAVCLENRGPEQNRTSTFTGNNFVHVLDCDSDTSKPSVSEVNTGIPASESTSYVHGSAIQADVNTTTSSKSVADTPVALSEGHSFEEASLTTETTTVANLVASVDTKASTKPESSTREAYFLSNLEQVGEEEKLGEKHQGGSSLEASLNTAEIVDANAGAVMEDQKVVPSSFIGNPTADEDDQLQEALLQEAEDINFDLEREAFAKQERDFLAKREELARQQAELQAMMEAEQAAIQTNLQEERDLLLQEEMELRASQRKNERNAESVSGEMFSECQELLQMFGLPYIIAPMEAEAQCAYMDTVGLVDGVVTDDCDVFLFGGRNVFKNIFDDRKYVETYYMKDVESELGLDQEKLIHMALLLGSDYTEGISGIGIVNAIEVVNAFEGEEGLQKFKEWLDAPDFTLLEKFHQDGRKKQARKKRVEREDEAEDNKGVEEPDDIVKYNTRQQDFMDRHRAVSKNWNVPESFPNPLVINAYKSPQVDNSSEPFTWGRPDLEALRRLCLEKFGWVKSKSDELLLPVLKEYDRHETQLRLEAFYSFNQRFAKIRSKRIQKAVSRGTGRLSSELVHFPKTDFIEDSSPTKEEKNDLVSKNEVEIKLAEHTKPSAKKPAGSRGRKRKGSPVETAIQEMTPRGRGRGGRKATRGRAKALKSAERRLSEELSLGDGSSTEDSDLYQNKGMEEVETAATRRSSRLTQRTVYNVSGSEDDNDGSGLGRLSAEGSPICVRGMTQPDLKNVEESTVSSSGKAVETETKRDCGDIGATSADGLYGLQEQGDQDYLIMGGGFCAPDADDGGVPSCNRMESHTAPIEGVVKGQEEGGAYLVPGRGFCAVDADDRNTQEPSCDPAQLHAETQDFVANGGLNITPEDTQFMGSVTLQELSSFGEMAGQSTGVETALRAVPALRRKKRRIS